MTRGWRLGSAAGERGRGNLQRAEIGAGRAASRGGAVEQGPDDQAGEQQPEQESAVTRVGVRMAGVWHEGRVVKDGCLSAGRGGMAGNAGLAGEWGGG